MGEEGTDLYYIRLHGGEEGNDLNYMRLHGGEEGNDLNYMRLQGGKAVNNNSFSNKGQHWRNEVGKKFPAYYYRSQT